MTDLQHPVMSVISRVDQLVDVFALGARRSESPGSISLAEHGLQCAEVIAQWYPADFELQVAGLLHDLAHHYLNQDDNPAEHAKTHGVSGGELVRDLLGDRVASMIEWHVPAKRYLVTYDSQYLDDLSTVSVQTLHDQGGSMSLEEGNTYRTLPEWNLALSLRRADDLAKIPGRQTRSFQEWIPILQTVSER
jgi:predicted HD phosphohydrolase